MGYPEHFLLQFGGSLGAGGEIWSCGIRLAEFGAGGIFGDVDEEQYLDDTAVPALKAWIARAGSKISSSCALNFAKFNQIDPEGHYADPGVTHERHFTNVVGAAASSGLSYQACVVLTFESTVVTRGLGSKGRIFSPFPVVSVTGSTGVFPTADALAIATSGGTLLNSLDVSVGVPPATSVLRPAIVSRGRLTGSTYGPGVKTEIDLISVDNRVDIQRRRANQIVAARSTVPILY